MEPNFKAAKNLGFLSPGTWPLVAIILFLFGVAPAPAKTPDANFKVSRIINAGLTERVLYPTMDGKGKFLIYYRDRLLKAGGSVRSLFVYDREQKQEKRLFKSGVKAAPAPFKGEKLIISQNPPKISTKGDKVIFPLSLSGANSPTNHYLGLVNLDGSGFIALSLKIEALETIDWKKLGFKGPFWERFSAYDISADGKTIACVVKGDLGPGTYRQPSAIAIINTDTLKVKYFLAPTWQKGEWKYSRLPMKVLTGGGWSFDLDDRGELLLFGGKPTPKKGEYDLYLLDTSNGNVSRLTDFLDRPFARGKLMAGKKVFFFYGGAKKEGVGTYFINPNKPKSFYFGGKGSRSFLQGFGAGGENLYYTSGDRGAVYNLKSGLETTIFKRGNLIGINSNIQPCEGWRFPFYPSGFTPTIATAGGSRFLATAICEQGQTPQFFLITLDKAGKQ